MSKEELIDLAKIDIEFKKNHSGKQPRFFQLYLNDIVMKLSEPTFANLRYRLELEAVKRYKEGEEASPIEV